MKDKIINHFRMIANYNELIGLSTIIVISAIGVLITQPNYDILTFLIKTFSTIQSFVTDKVAGMFTGATGDNVIVILVLVGLVFAILGNPISLQQTREVMVEVPGKRNRERQTVTSIPFSFLTLNKIIINIALQTLLYVATIMFTIPVIITVGFLAIASTLIIPAMIINSLVGNITISTIIALIISISFIDVIYKHILRKAFIWTAMILTFIVNITTKLIIGKMFIGQTAEQQEIISEAGEVVAQYRKHAENAIAALDGKPTIQKTMKKLGDMIEKQREAILKVGQNRNESNDTYSIRQYNMLPYASKEVIIKDGERHFLIPIHFQNSSNMTPSDFTSRLKASDLGIAFNPNKGGFTDWFIDHSKGGQLYLEVMTEALVEKVPDTVSFIEKLSTRLSELSFTKLKTAIGVNKKGQTVYVDPSSSEQIHLLIAGASGGGKSVFIEQILLDWIANLTPQQIRFSIVDPKMEYKGMGLGEVPHTEYIASGPKEISKAVLIVKQFVKEMNERYEFFSNNGTGKLSTYNEKNPDKAMPWKILIVDEMGGLMDTMEKGEREAFIKSLQVALQMARAAGMLILLSTQSPDSSNIPNSIRNNISSRICLKTKHYNQTNQILGMPPEDVDPRTFEGRGRAYVSAGSVNEEIRGFYISEDERKTIFNSAKEKYGKREEKEIVDDFEDLVEDEETAEDEYKKEEEQYNSDIQEVVIRENGFENLKTLNDNEKEKLYQALVDCFHNEGKVSKVKLKEYSASMGLENTFLFFQKVLEELDVMGITYKNTEYSRKLAVLDKPSIKGIVIKNLS